MSKYGHACIFFLEQNDSLKVYYEFKGQYLTKGKAISLYIYIYIYIYQRNNTRTEEVYYQNKNKNFLTFLLWKFVI